VYILKHAGKLKNGLVHAPKPWMRRMGQPFVYTTSQQVNFLYLKLICLPIINPHCSNSSNNCGLLRLSAFLISSGGTTDLKNSVIYFFIHNGEIPTSCLIKKMHR